MMRYIQN